MELTQHQQTRLAERKQLIEAATSTTTSRSFPAQRVAFDPGFKKELTNQCKQHNQRRLRGRFQHRHKSRVLRQHAQASYPRIVVQ